MDWVLVDRAKGSPDVRSGILLFWCLLLAGCLPAAIKPIPIAGTLEPGIRVIQESQAWSESIKSLRMLGGLVIDSKDSRFTVRLAVVYRAPQMMRVELLPLNSTVSLGLLVSDGAAATYVDFQGQRAIKGTLKTLLSYSMLTVSANEPELLSLLSGRIFKGTLPSTGVQVYHDQRVGTYQFVSDRGIWIIDDRTNYLQKVQLRGAEGAPIQLNVHYVEGSTGRKALIGVAGRKEVLEFSLDRMKVDTEIADSLFRITIPESFTVY